MGRPKGYKLSPEARERIAQKNRARWREGRKSRWDGVPRKTEAEKKARKAAADSARHRRQADAARRRPRKLPPEEKDAIATGQSILSLNHLRRPTFVVITPTGRRIETLDPKIV